MFSYLYDPIIHKVNLLVESLRRKATRERGENETEFCLFICLMIKHRKSPGKEEEAHFSPSELLNLN